MFREAALGFELLGGSLTARGVPSDTTSSKAGWLGCASLMRIHGFLDASMAGVL